MAEDMNPLPPSSHTGGVDSSAASASASASASSRDETIASPRGSSVSMEDPDVRLAAEALKDLKADFVQSPRSSAESNNLSSHPDAAQPVEPLLSLFTSSHPLLGGAINGSLSAYSSSKSYSPSFRYGAEFVERHIGSPVANTVGTVGRRTGMEGGVRWLLSSPSHEHVKGVTTSGSSTTGVTLDLEKGLANNGYIYAPRNPRRDSNVSFADSLPGYDDNTAPPYDSVIALDGAHPNWPRRLMLSTSGLGVSMSDESLRSLKYCLSWLRWSNAHLTHVIVSVKQAVHEWDQSRQHQSPDAGPAGNATAAENPDAETLLNSRIQTLKSDVLSTLQKVVDIVSTYTGAALPENARNLVKGHLISLPQRFSIAATEQSKDSSLPQPASAAHKVMVLAKEGLDMLVQVTNVVDGTINSAEDWLQRLGRRRADEGGNGFVDEKRSMGEKGNGSADVPMTDA